MILGMLRIILKPLAALSLPSIHRMGSALGFFMYCLMPKSSQLALENLKQSQLVKDETQLQRTVKQNVIESGKSIVETLAVWQKSEQAIFKLIKHIDGWPLIEAAQARGKGIIFLTPHMGCFEIAPLYYAIQHPVTVLYRPPKLKALQPLMTLGRGRQGITLAEANTGGVRKLMQALKRNEAIGILPDQIPAEGEGEWADFFGKPAYTMTLASKLAEKTGASVLMVFTERLANGEGYHIHLSLAGSIATPTLLNRAIEQQIKQMPAQYLWQYNRYKARRHAMQKPNAPKV